MADQAALPEVEDEIAAKFEELRDRFPEIGLAVLMGFSTIPALEDLLDTPEGREKYFVEAEKLLVDITNVPRERINEGGYLGFRVSQLLEVLIPGQWQHLHQYGGHILVTSDIRRHVSWMIY